MKYFPFYYILLFFIVWILHLSVNSEKTKVSRTSELDGTWNADKSFNKTEWDKSIQNGKSHEWFETLVIRNDSFFLEDHEWWPPYSYADGKEYFAANFTNYLIGTYLVRKDSLLLDGYSTDYTYSTRIDSSYKYHYSFLFKLNADTLELTEYFFLKQRMIRKK